MKKIIENIIAFILVIGFLFVVGLLWLWALLEGSVIIIRDFILRR